MKRKKSFEGLMSIFAGKATPQTRMRTWALHASVIEQKMNARAQEARHDYFENLYVLKNDDHRLVQMWAGNHPLSIKDQKQIQVEGGAALTVSQDKTLGHVVVFIYPYALYPNPVKPILWGVFDSPADITHGNWLDRIFLDYASCCRASSVVDQTAFTRDRLRMRWLILRSHILKLRGRSSMTTKVIKSRPSWGKRTIAGLAIAFGLLVAVTTLPSNLATLSGYSIPALWALWQSPPADDADAPKSSLPAPDKELVKEIPVSIVPHVPEPTVTAVTPDLIAMPVIKGRYTFCPSEGDQDNPKLLDLLYDVRANAGQMAFFDVQVGIDCVLSTEPDYRAPFYRIEEPGVVNYLMRVPLMDKGNLTESKQWISVERNPATLWEMYSDNGSAIAIHNGDDSRNPLSRFQPHVEGMTDILFGPYSIKESYDDDAITFDLNASFLDRTALQQATAIAKELRNVRAVGAKTE